MFSSFLTNQRDPRLHLSWCFLESNGRLPIMIVLALYNRDEFWREKFSRWNHPASVGRWYSTAEVGAAHKEAVSVH